MKSNYSKHHHIPKYYKECFEDKTELNSKKNISVIRNNVHQHIHGLHGSDTPAMILMDDVEFNMKILKEEFIKDLIEVFEKHFGNYYKVKVHIQDELGKLFELEKVFNSKYSND